MFKYYKRLLKIIESPNQKNLLLRSAFMEDCEISKWKKTTSWLPNQSDFPPISWPLYRAWPSPIMSGFHGVFATGVACQQGTLTLPDTWFRPPFWDLLMLQLLRPNSSNLPCLYSTFHLEYPLVLSRFCIKQKLSLSSLNIPVKDFGEKLKAYFEMCISDKLKNISTQKTGKLLSTQKFIRNSNYNLTWSYW